jgi:DNA-binding transcriptional LysR family regulator
MLDSDLLRTFIAIADTRNFTRAGDVVGRTQSAVSIQIKKLEETLGVALFDRSTRGVKLTYKGEQLLTRERRIVALLDDAEASIKASHLTGVVRIGIPEEYRNSMLPVALRRFALLHPGSDVIVRCAQSASTLAALDSGLLDIAVLYESSGSTEHEILRPDPVVWITSEIYNPHLDSPIPVAMYSIDTWDKQLAVAMLEAGTHKFRYSYYAETGEGLIAGVQAGLGIAPVARSSIPSGCRELTQAEGFPVLDESKVVLCVSSKAGALAQAMVASIRNAFRDTINEKD